MLESGQRLGGYRIEGLLGRGGMGEVYRATQLSMDRQVALKVLSPRLSRQDASFAEKFVAEARAAGRLNHPNIVGVHDVGLETPAGLYHIQNKAVNPAWNVPNSAWAGSLAGTTVPGGAPDNPLKARWMGIFDGAGIHGTDATGSIGSAASHGCIRMRIPDVIELYDQVPVGAPVYIA